ncbi:HlyD family secretion protein [Roseivirga misakiensis]|uniref:Membrane fusion protein biotin-lipoyl like domain-containing protein n=1 Tax=Roseivirga misakiensis TaxID=1563681 RepID=A0A1E5T692_9BACT|nr:HlyD family secretion protein [Roseivirga misakiensis]OEK06895.1 hypothetical protein BFP71_04365 [Roseivirga misakiensis]
MITEAKEKSEKTGLDIRSSAVTEIMGQAPNWVIRWGITVVLLIVSLIILGSALISYDDIIPARITVTSYDPPVYIEARSTGKVTDIFVEPDQLVVKDEVLAVIENTALLNDVLLVRRLIDDFKIIPSDLDSLHLRYPLTLSIGEIQNAYSQFITQYQNYLLYLKNQPNLIQANLLTDQISEQLGLLEKQKNQIRLFEKELELSLNAYHRSLSLLDSAIISTAEFESISRSYLGDKQRLEGLKVQVATTKISISNLNGSKTRLLLSDEETLYNNNQSLEQAVQNLKNAIADWEQRYLIKSPINGRVTLFDIWNEYQNVNVGTVLFTVVPVKVGAIIGRVVLPVQNSGKVSIGQKVIIKIDNYPHAEWGSLKGFVTNISSVPKQGLAEYAIQVSIADLNTSFGKTMAFKQEMQGSAEIVTEELTILQRIFYQLREVLSRG